MASPQWMAELVRVTTAALPMPKPKAKSSQ